MKLRQIYLAGKKKLEEAGVEAPAFDAVCLFEKVFGLDRGGMVVHGDEIPPAEEESLFFSLIERRSSGFPLQYLMGEWPFMGREFLVGPGVLIPREETELLVEAALAGLEGKEKGCRAVDLCAGTGIVGINLSLELPEAEITAVELSQEAFPYLEENIARHKAPVKAMRADVLKGPPPGFPIQDAVVSNPPYLTRKDMENLQKEVKSEPEMALRGGEDGLLFYRVIAEKWFPFLRRDGFAAVECGMGQAGQVAEIFHSFGLSEVSILDDFNGIGRVVTGRWRGGAS